MITAAKMMRRHFSPPMASAFAASLVLALLVLGDQMVRSAGAPREQQQLLRGLGRQPRSSSSSSTRKLNQPLKTFELTCQLELGASSTVTDKQFTEFISSYCRENPVPGPACREYSSFRELPLEIKLPFVSTFCPGDPESQILCLHDSIQRNMEITFTGKVFELCLVLHTMMRENYFIADDLPQTHHYYGEQLLPPDYRNDADSFTEEAVSEEPPAYQTIEYNPDEDDGEFVEAGTDAGAMNNSGGETKKSSTKMKKKGTSDNPPTISPFSPPPTAFPQAQEEDSTQVMTPTPLPTTTATMTPSPAPLPTQLPIAPTDTPQMAGEISTIQASADDFLVGGSISSPSSSEQSKEQAPEDSFNTSNAIIAAGAAIAVVFVGFAASSVRKGKKRKRKELILSTDPALYGDPSVESEQSQTYECEDDDLSGNRAVWLQQFKAVRPKASSLLQSVGFIFGVPSSSPIKDRSTEDLEADKSNEIPDTAFGPDPTHIDEQGSIYLEESDNASQSGKGCDNEDIVTLNTEAPWRKDVLAQSGDNETSKTLVEVLAAAEEHKSLLSGLNQRTYFVDETPLNDETVSSLCPSEADHPADVYQGEPGESSNQARARPLVAKFWRREEKNVESTQTPNTESLGENVPDLDARSRSSSISFTKPVKRDLEDIAHEIETDDKRPWRSFRSSPVDFARSSERASTDELYDPVYFGQVDAARGALPDNRSGILRLPSDDESFSGGSFLSDEVRQRFREVDQSLKAGFNEFVDADQRLTAGFEKLQEELKYMEEKDEPSRRITNTECIEDAADTGFELKDGTEENTMKPAEHPMSSTCDVEDSIEETTSQTAVVAASPKDEIKQVRDSLRETCLPSRQQQDDEDCSSSSDDEPLYDFNHLRNHFTAAWHHKDQDATRKLPHRTTTPPPPLGNDQDFVGAPPASLLPPVVSSSDDDDDC